MPRSGDRLAPPGRWGRAAGGLFLLGLLAAQGWLTLGLFGADRPWERLLDGRPIVSGRHPLHLYHGYLGARALREHGSPCCYDPAFQGGYPKTPVFDSGSRPAELFLGLAGGAYRPEAYKVGLAVCCAAVPLLVAAAARGLGPAAAGLSALWGVLVWWGTPGRKLLEAGDLDWLLASLACLLHLGLLVAFDRSPGLTVWLGLAAGGSLGWFAHPLLFLLLFPLVLVYYVSTGSRHRLGWHLALLAGLAAGPAVNSFWLIDWASHWWIRLPAAEQVACLRPRTLRTVWNADFWGGPADRALTVLLLGGAAVGVVALHRDRLRPAARLFALGAGSFLALAVAGHADQPLGLPGADRLLVPALLLSVPPAAYALIQPARSLGRARGWAVGGGGVVLVGLLAAHRPLELRSLPGAVATPFVIGLSTDRQALLATLDAHTDPGARILWEDQSGGRNDGRWTALLAVLTGRAFLGGLDPEARVEHAYAGCVAGKLAGRPVSQWSDSELADFARRYNVGWVVSWSEAVQARLTAWGQATPVAGLTDGERRGRLFAIRRERSFFLKGQGRWLEADCRRVTLADVVPEDGQVVLSLHYQSGMQAAPARVQVEPHPDPQDPIPFVRLRVAGPVARVTLTWEDR